MTQPLKQPNLNYPFGNPQPRLQQDAESYHSLTADDKKLKYFDENNQSSFSNKASQSMLRKKNPLPPVYPYEEMKKLKESMRSQKRQNERFQSNPGQGFDTQSIRSVDSFHTANEFQSICYEEGDFERIVGRIDENSDTKEGQGQLQDQVTIISKQLQSETDKQRSFQPQGFMPHPKNQQEKSPQFRMQMKRSSALDEAQLQELEESQESEEKYERFEQKSLELAAQKLPNQQQIQKIQQPRQPDYRNQQVEISRIQEVLNQSQQMDQEILQLTRELQMVHSSQEEMQLQTKISEEFIRKQEQLAERYENISKRIAQLQNRQNMFTSQIHIMNEIMKKTQDNNNYLKKQVEFFKQKTKEQQEIQRLLEQRQKQRKQNDIMNSSKTNYSSSLIESRTKPKTYHIRPKTANNLSYQSRKYKELTFEYCLRRQGDEQKWLELEIDRQNNPAEYRLIYSFQQCKSLLVIRLIQTLNQQQPQTKNPNPNPKSSSLKKNYHYMIDFAHRKYQTQEKKLQSLTKQLIVNLNEEQYCLKEFTKKIEIFLIISEEETFVDLVKVVPLPNPIAFFIEKRFDRLNEGPNKSIEPHSQNHKNNPPQHQPQYYNPIFKNLPNLCKFMKTYIIKIQHMADVESIQKLMNLEWVNTLSQTQPKYFSIKNKPNPGNTQQINQLFYVKIQNCLLESKEEHQKLPKQHRYSLVFRVASNIDNPLLVDLIEFLTFLTVI